MWSKWDQVCLVGFSGWCGLLVWVFLVLVLGLGLGWPWFCLSPELRPSQQPKTKPAHKIKPHHTLRPTQRAQTQFLTTDQPQTQKKSKESNQIPTQQSNHRPTCHPKPKKPTPTRPPSKRSRGQLYTRGTQPHTRQNPHWRQNPHQRALPDPRQQPSLSHLGFSADDNII